MIQQQHVLLIDDSQDLNWLNATRLRKMGVTVSVATNTNEALEAAIQKKPNLVLVDYSLGEITGPCLIQLIRSTLNINPLCALVTGYRSAQIEAEAEENDLEWIFQKPIKKEDLEFLISKCTTVNKSYNTSSAEKETFDRSYNSSISENVP